MKKIINLSIVASLLIAFSLPLAACNTVKGIGQDMKAAGDSISDSSGK